MSGALVAFPGKTWSFDIDRYLNPIVPPPPWKYVPRPIAHFLGHRTEKVRDMGNLRSIFWAVIGIFCALSIIQVVGLHISDFQDRGVPLIIGSFGAAAVLEFYAIESPLAQPRNAVLGQVLASIVGIALSKLFQLSDRYDEIRWLGGALACACATAVMALTKTVHPPAGATALLAVVDRDIAHIGWYLLPVMLLGLVLMLAVALLLNNIERQFPVYWWTPVSLARRRQAPGEGEEGEKAAGPGGKAGDDSDGGTFPAQRKRTLSTSDSGTEQTGSTIGGEPGSDHDLDLDLEAGAGRRKSSSRTAWGSGSHERDTSPATLASQRNEIVIRPGYLHVPEHFYLRQEELQYLEMLSHRLA